MQGRWRTVAGALGALLLSGASPTGFTNPILPDAADPWIARVGKTYYLMVTRGNRLTIRKTTDITKVAAAPEITVWTAPPAGPNARDVWAPELHRFYNRWFIYYTAADGAHPDNLHRGIFVLENDGPDPTKGRWIDRGRVNISSSGIDATVFGYRGRYYLVYSAQTGSTSRLAIAQLKNPWTIGTREVIISRPDHDWERQTYAINEGPEFLEGPKGELFLTFSASACTSDDYAIGLLSAPPGSNPLNPRAWTKAPDPVITKSPAVSVFATGHNGFFTSPDGKQHWIAFHANAGPSQGCTGNRSLWVEPFTFGSDDRPIFLPPTGPGDRMAPPTGQAPAGKG